MKTEADLKRKWGEHLTFDPDKWQVLTHKHEWALVGYRPPKAGEYYVSGAIPEAYQAPNDLTSSCWVVTKGHEVRLRRHGTR